MGELKRGVMGMGKHLTFERKRLGLTQQEVADKLGISRNRYAQYETDFAEPGHEILTRISAVFDVNIEVLFFGRKLSTLEKVEKLKSMGIDVVPAKKKKITIKKLRKAGKGGESNEQV